MPVLLCRCYPWQQKYKQSKSIMCQQLMGLQPLSCLNSLPPVIFLMDLIFCHLHSPLAGWANMLAGLDMPGSRPLKGSIWLSGMRCFQGHVWIKHHHLGQARWNLHAHLLFCAVISTQPHLTPMQWHLGIFVAMSYCLSCRCWWIKPLVWIPNILKVIIIIILGGSLAGITPTIPQ